MFEDQEWGMWTCPYCGCEYYDPECISITTCGKCGQIILLSGIDEYGYRKAYKEEIEINKINKKSLDDCYNFPTKHHENFHKWEMKKVDEFIQKLEKQFR